MDVKEAITTAKSYVKELYAEEEVTSIGLEEVKFIPKTGNWLVTLSFSRASNSPKTRAADVLEKLGALQRILKVITISKDGSVLSMKNP